MPAPPRVDPAAVTRLWLERQGLAEPRGTTSLTKRALTRHLETTGGLQLDSVNVLDRAHYLTLWSRFGAYDRRRLDRWVYAQRAGFEHWGHEASILPSAHLPLALRAMRRFPPPSWKRAAWWKHYAVPRGVKQRVLRRLREEGPLESAHFEDSGPRDDTIGPAWAAPLGKASGRALKMLWHAGDVAVHGRRHFRRLYDLAERVYPAVEPASPAAFEDHWLLQGLRGNGVASEAHLTHYLSAPHMKAPDRKRVIARNLRRNRVVELRVEGVRGACYALPEDVERLEPAPEPRGTHLLCPFDSLLWQRRRAEELLGFRYRLEIYVPAAKREFGYYVLPVLHDGRFVGRLDPKLDREHERLEVLRIDLEPGVRLDAALRRGLRAALEDLARFLGAAEVRLPKPWRRRLGT